MTGEPSYPVVRFLERRGDFVAVVVGLLPVVTGVWAAAAGHGWWLALVGAAGGVVFWLLMRSYVEVIRIIAETLLPR